MYRVERINPSVAPEDVVHFEARTGISLPEDYRTFLLRFNGGRPVPDAFDIPDRATRVRLDVLLGINPDNAAVDIEQELNDLEGRLPEGFIPIGRDPGGCPLLLCTLGEERGKLYYWDMDYILDATDEEGNTYEIAEGIHEFLEGLKD